MNHTLVQSSNIYSLAHCAETQTLQVRFKDKDGSPSGLYEYIGVPAWVYTGMKNAPSIGAYFAARVKGHYAVTKLN